MSTVLLHRTKIWPKIAVHEQIVISVQKEINLAQNSPFLNIKSMQNRFRWSHVSDSFPIVNFDVLRTIFGGNGSPFDKVNSKRPFFAFQNTSENIYCHVITTIIFNNSRKKGAELRKKMFVILLVEWTRFAFTFICECKIYT